MMSERADTHAGHGGAAPGRGYLLKTSLTALGVVYGDIGTSPLYALRECFSGEHAVAVSHDNVLGLLSVIFWSLLLIISLKYVAYVMRADNRGEGGILALMSLATSKHSGKRARWLLVIGLFGASLLYGDGVITPAISVLSAVEGLGVAAPQLQRMVVPITIAILVLLFVVQRRGSSGLGAVFGPITLTWFLCLSAIGVWNIARRPEVLGALNPTYAVWFLTHTDLRGLLVLGAVFLVITGAEALYADMGHFGAKPIRLAWFFVVFPALVLNYLGQGAAILQNPAAATNPFFLAAPSWGLFPLIVLATVAAIIASQALISGAFSITRQAIMLGYFPRVDVAHTSPNEMGQIYVPIVNYGLMFAAIALVLGFGSSTHLAAAYGIAVTLTMLITTTMAFVVAKSHWRWPLPVALLVTLAFAIPELAFCAANMTKIADGGWFPLVLAATVFLVMSTWKRGRELLGRRIREGLVPLEDFFELLRVERPARVPGTAVFMTSNPDGTPPAMMQNFLHNRVVHQRVILLTAQTKDVARVAEDERLTIEELGHNFTRVTVRYGFMEHPDIPRLLIGAGLCDFALEHATFFVGRETVLAGSRRGMARWREHLFALLTRNAQRATAFFNIPSDRVVELGSQVEL